VRQHLLGDLGMSGTVANDEQALCDAVHADVQAVFKAVSSRRKEADSAVEEAERECKRLRAAAKKAAEEVTRKAREERAALEEEKAAMENTYTFQQNQIPLNVGGGALHPSTFLQLLNLSRFVSETPPKFPTRLTKKC